MLDTLIRALDMVRLSAAMVMVLAAFGLTAIGASGCTGIIDNGSQNAGLTPEQAIAKDAWLKKALPALRTNCIACHGSQVSIDFLKGAGDMDIRDNLVAFTPEVVNLDAVQSSRLVTKGTHNGPSLSADDASSILEWISAEKDAQSAGMGSGSGGPVLETKKFSVLICTGGVPGDATCPINTVLLDDTGLAGAKITFVAQALSDSLYVNDLYLEAGTDGAYLEHPLFVSWPAAGGTAKPDAIDRFFNVKMNLMAATKDQIGGGAAPFVGFIPSDQLSVHFKVVKPYQPGTGGTGGTGGTTGGGCKKLTEFKANAQGPLSTNCGSCHANKAAQPAAVSAMDLTGIAAADDVTLQGVCNQALTRVNKVTPLQSGFYIAPNPGNATNHPFKFPSAGAFGTFKTSMDVWINAEITAP
jgi:mono/diheme cytochrome c family protein